MTSWHSYPKVYNLGHDAIKDLLIDPPHTLVVQEKIDGSQFSFGRFGEEIKRRSKGHELPEEGYEKMFTQAVTTTRTIGPHLREGWTYRAEFLQKPKHNVLAYDRVPNGHLILFDINTAEEAYVSQGVIEAEAQRLGIEAVPEFKVDVFDMVSLERLLLNTSILGGQKIEGFVIKNYGRFAKDGHALMGKFVSEAYKEIHKSDWKERNPGKKDVIQGLIDSLRTPARWQKAVQHMKEAGKLEDSPKDIGLLIKAAQQDILEECKPEIESVLMKFALPQILRGVTAGLPEWYKKQLAEKQFNR